MIFPQRFGRGRRRRLVPGFHPGRAVVPAVLIAVAYLVLSAAPVRAVTVVGPTSHFFEAETGTRLQGRLELHNPGREPGRVRVGLADYVFGPEGADIRDVHVAGDKDGAAKSHSRSAASWIKFSRLEAHLDPGETVAVPYEIVVPRQLPASGAFWALIVVEVSDEDRSPAGKERLGEQGVAVGTVVRYGIQVVIDVGQGVGPRPRLDSATLARPPGDGPWLFSVDVANDGDTLFSPAVTLELYEPDGGLVGTFSGPSRSVYPGGRTEQVVALSSDLSGSYVAVLVLDGGGSDVFAARFDLDVPGGGGR